jgi:succinylglutamate desuccinylase
VREGLSFRFGDPYEQPQGQAPTDIVFDQMLDRRNFRELEAGEVFGHSRHALPLVAIDEAGHDISAEYFAVMRGRLRLARPTMPAMLSSSELAVRQDCLCYLMERLPFQRLRQLGLALEPAALAA